MKRRQYLLLVALTIISGLVGGAVSSCIFANRQAIAQEHGGRVIRAEEFKLIDKNGTLKGVFGISDDLPILLLMDEKSDSRLAIGFPPTGPAVEVKSGESVASISACGDSTSLSYGASLSLRNMEYFANMAVQGNFPGWIPYIPGRLEWLALKLTAGALGNYKLSQDGFRLEFMSTADTLHIIVRHISTVDREIMNEAIETAKASAIETINAREWGNWAKIEEDIKMVDVSIE